nr:PREDICTED: UDP-glucuronosyltransferase 2A3-like [Bemisia tabaci]
MCVQFFFNVLILCCGANAFNILILSPTPSFSHQRPILALAESLVRKGHKLFVAGPNTVPGLEQNENYTFVDLSFSYNLLKNENGDGVIKITTQRQLSKWEVGSAILSPVTDLAKSQLTSDQFLRFKQRVELENIKFDVVIVQPLFIPYLTPTARVLAGDAPIIAVSSYVMDWMTEDALGSPVHLSFSPSVFGHYTDRMNLLQRIENWFSHHYVVSGIKRTIEASARRFFTEEYGLNATFVDESPWERISLTLITSNSLYYYPRQLGPNVVEVGPLHLETPDPLPKNLQSWLDGAGKGVIYFSLGSNMQSRSLPREVVDNFSEFFRSLPPGYRVLWKWESDEKIPGQSDNILAQKWMPQHSVLAHPKVRLFITQGGLQSFQEAVHFGVPTITIPWFSDQECTAAKMVDANIGEKLSPQDIHTFTKIKTAIETVLYDESYLKNMKKLSGLSHEFTSQAMDKAVFWVEHVARHKGASHLRPSTSDSNLFQYFCLDLISVIVLSSLSFIFLIYSIVYYILNPNVYSKSNGKLKHS